MRKSVRRPGVRDGYDRWAESYDATSNPLVALDRRHTPRLLQPRRGERMLDVACGTGAYLGAMARAGSRPVGLDLSRGMLQVARRKYRDIPVAQADLNQALPVRTAAFDAVVCALVGEHLTNLRLVFGSCAAASCAAGDSSSRSSTRRWPPPASKRTSRRTASSTGSARCDTRSTTT
ncbi:MAG: class I SAM-dependent methyltransferase [Deltaproteobacteria bacterium]|nr:class I SAM-dependent methyltransferase [Deltaproteobacteria bacterium]